MKLRSSKTLGLLTEITPSFLGFYLRVVKIGTRGKQLWGMVKNHAKEGKICTSKDATL